VNASQMAETVLKALGGHSHHTSDLPLRLLLLTRDLAFKEVGGRKVETRFEWKKPSHTPTFQRQQMSHGEIPEL
jgi:hypothetical protein